MKIVSTIAALLCIAATPALANPPAAMANPPTVSQVQSQSQSIAVQRGGGRGQGWQGSGTAIYAPGLAAGGEGVCLGSVSAGASAGIFGLIFGTTTKDDDCRMRKHAALLLGLGHDRAALARACMSDEIREAMKIAGDACPQDERERDQTDTEPSQYNPAAGRFTR